MHGCVLDDASRCVFDKVGDGIMVACPYGAAAEAGEKHFPCALVIDRPGTALNKQLLDDVSHCPDGPNGGNLGWQWRDKQTVLVH